MKERALQAENSRCQGPEAGPYSVGRAAWPKGKVVGDEDPERGRLGVLVGHAKDFRFGGLDSGSLYALCASLKLPSWHFQCMRPFIYLDVCHQAVTLGKSLRILFSLCPPGYIVGA